MDYGELEVIVVHKPDLKEEEIKALIARGYCDRIKDTLFKITTHRSIAEEEKMLTALHSGVSYETTGHSIEETSKYILYFSFDEDGKNSFISDESQKTKQSSVTNSNKRYVVRKTKPSE